MNICIVTETYPPEVNGVAMTLHRIGNELRRQGHGLTIVRPRQTSEAQHAKYDNETIVPGLPLPGYDGLRFGLPCRRKLRELWSKQRPDIIYAATEGPLGQSAIKAASDLGIAIVSGFHTNFHEYMKHYKLPILEKIVRGFLRKTHNKTLRTFAPSQDVIDRLNEMGIQGTRLLGRGVDTELFSPSKRDDALRQRWGVDENGIAAIFVSRLAAEKNIPLATEAFERVKQSHPKAACVFVGDGPERSKLEKDHPDYIFAGMQKGEDLAKHYASADLFVFPSVTETFGNVVTEAMASGLVTLAFNYAAPRRFINDGENGFLAPFDNNQAFLESVDRAMITKRNWSKIGDAARSTAEPLGWHDIVKKFVEDLQEAISN